MSYDGTTPRDPYFSALEDVENWLQRWVDNGVEGYEKFLWDFQKRFLYERLTPQVTDGSGWYPAWAVDK